MAITLSTTPRATIIPKHESSAEGCPKISNVTVTGIVMKIKLPDGEHFRCGFRTRGRCLKREHPIAAGSIVPRWRSRKTPLSGWQFPSFGTCQDYVSERVEQLRFKLPARVMMAPSSRHPRTPQPCHRVVLSSVEGSPPHCPSCPIIPLGLESDASRRQLTCLAMSAGRDAISQTAALLLATAIENGCHVQAVSMSMTVGSEFCSWSLILIHIAHSLYLLD
jgi:hypothetical protein